MKVSFGNLSEKRPANGRRGGHPLPGRRIRTEAGALETVYTVDAHSETVGQDILTLFKLNAARARRQTREAMKLRGTAAE